MSSASESENEGAPLEKGKQQASRALESCQWKQPRDLLAAAMEECLDKYFPARQDKQPGVHANGFSCAINMENLVSRLQDEYDEDQFNGGSGVVLGGLDDGNGLLRGNSDPEVMFRITRSGRRVHKADPKAGDRQVASTSAQKAVKPPPKPKKSAKDILQPPNLGYGRKVVPRVGEKRRRRDYDEELNNLVNVQLDFEDLDGVAQFDFEDLDSVVQLDFEDSNGVYRASTPGSEASSFS
ncbi:hypothetical protein OF83DRAFT_1084177 [Amylostereum chailletii]|nr:hypothetical protein OF83DRAFT_1084177 [Amylostereum chailletii]